MGRRFDRQLRAVTIPNAPILVLGAKGIIHKSPWPGNSVSKGDFCVLFFVAGCHEPQFAIILFFVDPKSVLAVLNVADTLIRSVYQTANIVVTRGDFRISYLYFDKL